MITVKKLGGGGDIAVTTMINNAAMLGVDIIELLWIPRNKLPHMGVIRVSGYKTPIIDAGANIYEDGSPSSDWVDGTLKFYPDDNGHCWGYVYDTKDNRDLIASSLANGWYRIVDSKIKDEIIKYAKSMGYRTEPYPTTQILVKKNSVEKAAEARIKEMQEAEFALKEKLRLLEEELAVAKQEKSTHLNKRLRGVEVKETQEKV